MQITSIELIFKKWKGWTLWFLDSFQLHHFDSITHSNNVWESTYKSLNNAEYILRVIISNHGSIHSTILQWMYLFKKTHFPMLKSLYNFERIEKKDVLVGFVLVRELVQVLTCLFWETLGVWGIDKIYNIGDFM